MNMSSKVRHAYDAANVSIAPGTSTAQAASTDGTAVAIDRLSAAYWQVDNTMAANKYSMVIVVESDDSSAGVTYTVEIDTVVGFGSPVTLFTTTDLPVGETVVPLDESIMEHLEAGTAYVRCTIDVAAGTGSCEAGAWLSQPSAQ